MEGPLSSTQQIADLCDTVRTSGYRVTSGRQAVIEVLFESTTHVTAPDLVAAVQKRAPGVGRASVYRTLDLLMRLGLVQSSTLGRASATYVLTPNKHHHHVVCIECHKTVEFDDCVLHELETRLCKSLGFRPEGHLVELYGRCPDCL
jgi:Fur family peroxide stress response transcriptional regulator